MGGLARALAQEVELMVKVSLHEPLTTCGWVREGVGGREREGEKEREREKYRVRKRKEKGVKIYRGKSFPVSRRILVGGSSTQSRGKIPPLSRRILIPGGNLR